MEIYILIDEDGCIIGAYMDKNLAEFICNNVLCEGAEVFKEILCTRVLNKA